MSKAYSNKALPAGTVLREWRLEQVLGVGGFGIVYKGRGIYFDELVAIKEYFPSSISERDEDATVVPIDSDAEEVHALGLKKFVEEAKLLWNLSTPTRHPNIVSVRSLFEVHGTAYMVMDFEDGMSLSKLIKNGTKWDEESLLGLVKPIAQGLERAHRVGVLHRDIKPPNILVNDDGRPVLIDFGSARFESGEATSTSVTFHTPPYAAIEQYVKTYDQGPWTDVYALGVVLHECVTGVKPPEVLERMHAGLGTPLAEGDWPGYSRSFLAAIDTAMIVRPGDRPQSISEWLALFDAPDTPVVATAPEQDFEDEDATRIATFVELPEEIAPVDPPASDAAGRESLATAVPSDPSEVEFKGAGQETGIGKKKAEKDLVPPPVSEDQTTAGPPEAEPPEADRAPEPEPKSASNAGAATVEVKAKPVSAPAGKSKAVKKPRAAKPAAAAGGDKNRTPLLIGAGAAALLVLGAGGYFLSGGDEGNPVVDQALLEQPPEVEAVNITELGGMAQAVSALVGEAREAKAPAAAVDALNATADQLRAREDGLQALASDPARMKAAEAQMAQAAQAGAAAFAGALVKEADGKVRSLARDLPWADPRKANAAASQNANLKAAAGSVRTTLGQLRAAAQQAGEAKDPGQALTLARQALAGRGAYNAAIAQAYRLRGEEKRAPDAAQSTASSAETAAPIPSTTATLATVDPGGKSGAAGDLFPAKYRSFNSTVKSARSLADDVARMGRGSEPGSGASKDEKDGYRIRQANVRTAQNYVSYLDTLTNSMRGKRTEQEVDSLIASAEETRRYLQQLKLGSQATTN